MPVRPNWALPYAVDYYQDTAQEQEDDFRKRYDWTGYTEADVANIYAEIIAKLPAGVSVLELGCGDGTFYKALKAARPGVTYKGIDLAPSSQLDSTKAKAKVTLSAAQIGDTITVAGTVFTAANTQVSGANNFDRSATSKKFSKNVAVASSLVAAINDPANGISGTVKASNNAGKSEKVTLRAVTAGVGGNALTLASSDAGRLNVSGGTLSGGVVTTTFETQNLWDYLYETTPTWDVIVSVNCAWSTTDHRGHELLFDLINARAPKGFIVLATPQADVWAAKMPGAIGASTAVTESYYTGARAFLADALVQDLRPILLFRTSTTAVVPEVPLRYRGVVSGAYSEALGRQQVKRAGRKGQALPVNYKGVTTTSGLVTGTAVLAVTPRMSAGIRVRTLNMEAESTDE